MRSSLRAALAVVAASACARAALVGDLRTPAARAAAVSAGARAAPRVGDNWGTNIHFTTESTPGELAMLSTAFRVARMDFSWGSIERAGACGTYNFTDYDGLLSALDAVGVRAYWILDYANPACYPDPNPAAPASSCASASCVAAYGRLAAAAAAHFAGRGIVWESVNEPNGMGHDNATDLAALAAAAGAPLRAAGETFLGPATAGIDFPYLAAAFAAGLLRSVSGVSVHPYRTGAPESAAADFAALRALMTAAGADETMPMNGGEWGYTSASTQCNYGNKRDRVTAGKFVPRMFFANLLGGASLTTPAISYDWKNDGANLSNCEDKFGAVERTPTGDPAAPFLPKPAFLAARSVQATVGGAAAFAGRVPAVADAAAAAANVTARDVFVLAFAGGALRGGAAFAAYTNVTTCAAAAAAAARPACGGAPPGAGEAACLATGCCFAPANASGVRDCYAAPALDARAAACPAAGARNDCGFLHISEAECVGARGCCWDAAPGAGPQCFFQARAGTFNATFPVAPLAAGTCFDTTDVFGFARGRVCADGGAVSVALSDGPLYLALAA